MDFRDLTYVTAIAKYQSITKAANSLYVSQPTLTKFLQNTEQQLGLKLFDRVGKSFVLTYAGERYVASAKEILTIKANLEHELTDIALSRTGSLRIGLSSIRGSQIIRNVIPTFVAHHPKVQLKFLEINQSSFEPMLLAGDVDLLFVNLPIQNPTIEYQVLDHEEVLLVAPADHPLTQQAVTRTGCRYPWVDLRHICKEDAFIMLSPELRIHNIVSSLLESSGVLPNISFYTKNVEAACILASEGHGLTFCGEHHIFYTKFDRPPALFSIGDPCTQRTFVAAYRKNFYLSNYVQDLIDLAKNRPSIPNLQFKEETL